MKILAKFYPRILLYLTVNLLSIISACAQVNIGKRITVGSDIEHKVILLLKERHGNDGECENLQIYEAFIGTVEESGDYGPMWYGDTLSVQKKGYLLSYEYDKVDKEANKSKPPFKSNEWHSSERLFISNDCLFAFRMYTCHFGFPPSFGYAEKQVDISEQIKHILDIINDL